MKTRSVAWLLAAIGLVSTASAQAYSNLFVFGDSLSDSGNIAALYGTDPTQVITGNTYIPTLPYGSGNYTNGTTWAQRLAGMTGLASLPSVTGGTNYAFGGAQTSGGSSPSLTVQTGMFLSAYGNVAPSDALYVVAGGGNNARAALQQMPGKTPAEVAAIIAAAASAYAADVGGIIDSLQLAGAQHIIVWDTPDVGLAPAILAGGPAASGVATFLAGSMNLALLGRLSTEPDVKLFDLFGLQNAWAANPAAYGLDNVVDACGAVVGCAASKYLFWDGIHPTSGGHELVAKAMYTLAVPEPATYGLLLVGLFVVGAVARRRSH